MKNFMYVVLGLAFVASLVLGVDQNVVLAAAGAATITQVGLEMRMTYRILPNLGQDNKVRIQVHEAQVYSGIELKSRNGFLVCDDAQAATIALEKLNSKEWKAALIGNRPQAGGAYEAVLVIPGVNDTLGQNAGTANTQE